MGNLPPQSHFGGGSYQGKRSSRGPRHHSLVIKKNAPSQGRLENNIKLSILNPMSSDADKPRMSLGGTYNQNNISYGGWKKDDNILTANKNVK
jgi:hypothetical protein